MYEAIGGSQIKKFTHSESLIKANLSTQGYIAISIPQEITNENVVSVYCHTSSIAATAGFQLTPIYCGGGKCYLNYYKPSDWSYNSVDFDFELTYII